MGLNQPHISHRHQVGRNVSQRVSQEVPVLLPPVSVAGA